MGGTQPSAHALGYRLTALRAWGYGLGPEAAQVHRDRTRFFPVSFRYRCRSRSRSRRVWRGVAGRPSRPMGACRVGSLRMATGSVAMELDLRGRSRSSRLRVRFHSTAEMAHAKTRRREGGSGRDPVRVGFVSVVDLLAGQRREVEARSAWAAGLAHAKTQRRKGGGTKTGCLPVLASLRLERSGREEFIRVGRCTACETAEGCKPCRGRLYPNERSPRGRCAPRATGFNASGVRGSVKPCGQICPLDKSIGESKALRIGRAGERGNGVRGGSEVGCHGNP
jgi:hypothetical protein